MLAASIQYFSLQGDNLRPLAQLTLVLFTTEIRKFGLLFQGTLASCALHCATAKVSGRYCSRFFGDTWAVILGL